MSKSFLYELRDAARTCPNVKLAKALRAAADGLDDALANLTSSPTRAAMELVNGRWAYAYRILADAQDAAPGGAGGSLRDGAELTRMAA